MSTIGEMMTEEEFDAEEAELFQSKGDGNWKSDAAAGPGGAGRAGVADETMPILPEGFGLDYDELQMMLAKVTGTVLCKQEPIMMMVPFCNIFLEQLRKLNSHHNEALTNFMADHSGKYIRAVKEVTDGLSATLADKSISAIRDAFKSHTSALNTNRNNARWCAGIMAVSALVNVAVMALRMWG